MLQIIEGRDSGSGREALGHSLWMIAERLAEKFRGFSPQAGNVQKGAPDPPEKRLHYSED